MDAPLTRNAPGMSRSVSEGRDSHWTCRRETTPPGADRQAFRHSVGVLEAFETLADWREDLDARIDRAQLRFELVGFDIEEQRALYTEGQAWKRVCSALLYNGEAAQ